MTNRISLKGVVLAPPKIRPFESRGEKFETVSLWIEVRGEQRADRFTIEIHCPKAQATAKAMKPGVIAEATGALRHDRYIAKASGQWAGKIYVAIEPGAGVLRSHGLAAETTRAA